MLRWIFCRRRSARWPPSPRLREPLPTSTCGGLGQEPCVCRRRARPGLRRVRAADIRAKYRRRAIAGHAAEVRAMRAASTSSRSSSSSSRTWRRSGRSNGGPESAAVQQVIDPPSSPGRRRWPTGYRAPAARRLRGESPASAGSPTRGEACRLAAVTPAQVTVAAASIEGGIMSLCIGDAAGAGAAVSIRLSHRRACTSSQLAGVTTVGLTRHCAKWASSLLCRSHRAPSPSAGTWPNC